MLQRPQSQQEQIEITESYDDDIVFELGCDGVWRAYSPDGMIAYASTFREIYERIGGRWN